MKKIILLISLSVLILACNKTTPVNEAKTAYVDTSELIKESIEAKELEAKYKKLADEKSEQLKSEINRFKQEATNFQAQAQARGQEWAQQKGMELQRREQELGYAQQTLGQQLQQESGKEMDSLIAKVKKTISTYGKEKGYDYIYGTGEIASVLYAKEKYDITKDLIKIINENYKPGGEKKEKDTIKK